MVRVGAEVDGAAHEVPFSRPDIVAEVIYRAVRAGDPQALELEMADCL